MSLTRKKLHAFFIFTATISSLLMRPSLLRNYAPFFYAFLIGSLLSIAIINKSIFTSKRKLVFLLCIICLCVYISLQRILMAGFFTTPTHKVVLTVLGATAIVFCVDKNTWDTLILSVIYLVLFCFVSYVFTFALYLSGVQLESLIVKEFIRNNGSTIWIYFPFSAVNYTYVDTFGYDIPRLPGIYPESGLFQALVVVSFFGADLVGIYWKKTTQMVSVLLLFLCQSTAGIIVFLVSFIYYYFISNRSVKKVSNKLYEYFALGTIFVSYLYISLFSEVRFSLFSKLEFASGVARTESWLHALNVFIENPIFGAGFGTEETYNLFWSQLGLFGSLILIGTLVLPNLSLIRQRSPALVFLVPAFLTSFPQPLFGKAVFFIIISLTVSYNYTRTR